MARDSKGGWLLYVMIHIPLIFMFKVGITSMHIGAKKRAAGIDREMWGYPLPIFFVVIPGAYHIEQWFHRSLSAFNFRFYKGSGASEWFVLVPLITVLPFMLAVWATYLGIVDYFCGTTALPFCFEFICSFVEVLMG
jgi:hypothetical protein